MNADVRPGPAGPDPVDALFETPVVLYDGWCNLCDSTVAFIVRRDRRGAFRFAALQSAAGARLIARCGSPPDGETIVLVQGERCATRSEAVLAILGRLPPPWNALRHLRVVPRPWRDAAYDVLARHRHRWFGRPSTCWMALPSQSERFLE